MKAVEGNSSNISTSISSEVSGVDEALVSQETLPMSDHDRNINNRDLFFLWAAIAINIGAFAMALSLYPQYSPLQIIGVMFAGFLICVVLIIFVGDIGLTYGITYSVYIRSCFGIKGSHIPGVIRMLSCLFWAGFQTYVAATALHAILITVIGYSNLWVCIIVFQAAQVINASRGVKSMAFFNMLATVFLTITLGFLTMTLIQKSDFTVLGIMSELPVPTEVAVSLPLAIAGAAGGWIAIAPTFMDITRTMKRSPNFATQTFWQRNKGVVVMTLLGITLVSPLVVGTGMISGIITGHWNPIEFAVEAFSNNIFLLIICFIAILAAQWSTNTAANMLPAANIIVNFSPKYISFAMGMVIVGILSLALMPWKLIDQLAVVLAYLAVALGPIIGIMLADYYIIRKRKLNVKALYQASGQYQYWKDLNPAALITVAVSLVVSFLVVSVDLGFYVGFVTSIVIYWVLMKYWIIPKYPQEELNKDYQPNYYFGETNQD